MPNRTGGKNYKKSKQTGSLVKPFIDRQEGQLYARILRNLGGRNMLVYCNDNKIRLCHICGAMKKFDWLQVGDLVLISLRDFEKTDTEKYPKGDILAKYDSDHISRLKKLPDINKKLFYQLETMDGKILEELGSKEPTGKIAMPGDDEMDDSGIVFEHDEKKEGEAEEEDDKEIDIDDI